MGWDFIRNFKLDFVWGDNDEEIYIHDKKAKIKSKLKFKPFPWVSPGTCPSCQS